MKTSRYILVATLLFSLNFTGCSVIGYSIGSYATDDRAFNKNPQEIALIDSAETITVITKDERRIKGEFISFSKLANDEDKDKLPVVSKLYVKVRAARGAMFSFPLEDIKEIIINESNYNWLVGFIFGAAIDAILINEFIYAMNHMSFG